MKTIIHVGQLRAGSTWLQTKLFPFIKVVHPTKADWEHVYENSLRFVGQHPPDAAPLVLSNELLASYAWGAPGMAGRAKLLKSMFPDAEILLIVREPKAQLESLFRWAVKNEFEWSRRAFTKRAEKIRWWLDSRLIVKMWEREFKVVHVLDFEHLQDDPQGFADKVCFLLGVETIEVDATPENASVGGLRFMAMRAVNWAKSTLMKGI